LNPTGGGTKHHAAAQNKFIRFLAGINVSLPEVATVVQEMISLYALWDHLIEGSGGEAATAVAEAGMKETEPKRKTMTEREVVQLVAGMRAERELDNAHLANGMPIDKRLERTQAV
jgi:cyclin C